MDVGKVSAQVRQAVTALLNEAALESKQILVVGCSTSEVVGEKIGTKGSGEVAQAILDPLLEAAAKNDIYVAIQCCEHLNRALVIERPAVKEYNLEPVTVLPVAKAGGSLAARAYEQFKDPVTVETIQAHAGMDIGDTFIGMHLKQVAVPVRLKIKEIGNAHLTVARTRPKLIGGQRAVYC